VAAEVFAARGIEPSFFQSDASHLHAPERMLGLPRALDRLGRARAERQHIRLVTDYDVDGTTSCLILHAALDRLGGAQVSYHIPDRFTEGYGLSLRAVETAAADGVHLIVTADIGVRDHASVRRAAELGVDVLVCDHHLPAGESVPDAAVAVLCPPQPGCGYPNKSLAACGVSLKLATALLAADPRRDEVLGSLLKLAAIGTVADVVDLHNAENRAIVTLGLAALNRGPHSPGLTALLSVAGARSGEITAETLGWRIGPRINAAGRLADANAVVRLLRERDPAAALAQAARLDELNRERQDIQERLVDTVLGRLPADPPPFVVVSGTEEEGFHRGVVGIVAAKVRERVGRPVAIVSTLGELSTGSVRSVPRVHATRALDSVQHLLHRHGGHAAAAGFTVSTRDLPGLAEALAAFVAAHEDDDVLVPEEVIDAVVDPPAVDLRLIADLARLEPTGKGNAPARLVVRGVASDTAVLKERHVRFRLGPLRCLWWNGADRADQLARAREVLGSASLNTWNGRTDPQLVVEDVR
jgi:single-stranded-DNA-specific exonuclease